MVYFHHPWQMHSIYVCRPVCPSVRLSVCFCICLSVCLPVCLSVYCLYGLTLHEPSFYFWKTGVEQYPQIRMSTTVDTKDFNQNKCPKIITTLTPFFRRCLTRCFSHSLWYISQNTSYKLQNSMDYLKNPVSCSKYLVNLSKVKSVSMNASVPSE
jgi:hypothetical protein